MAEDHGLLLSNSLLSNEELLVELARARKEAERQQCPDLDSGACAHDGALRGGCACARMHDLEQEVEVRLARRRPPLRHVARAG